MIPHKIHYCWFGGNPLPELAQKCIASWKKFLPDYEIIEWNESNYDVHKIPYISDAYDSKKYAFVSDYARFDILYEQGGVYFDTDVEVLKDITELCEKGNWCGVESAGALAAGLGIAAQRREEVFREILDSYEKSSFKNQDGSLNLLTVVERVSDIFRKHGFTNENKIQNVANFTIYTSEYFCPKNVQTGVLSITPNTYTIHHYDSSWCEEWQKQVQRFRFSVNQKFGNNRFSIYLGIFYHILLAMKNLGLKKGFKYCKEKFVSIKNISKNQKEARK